MTDAKCADARNMYFAAGTRQNKNAGAGAGAPRSLVGAAGDFAVSMARFAASGFKTVDAALHELRMGHCRPCEHRRNSQCALCRCFVDKKAWLPHEDCPLGRWPV